MEPKIAKVSEEVLQTLAEGDIKITHILARIEKDEVSNVCFISVDCSMVGAGLLVCGLVSNWSFYPKT